MGLKAIVDQLNQASEDINKYADAIIEIKVPPREKIYKNESAELVTVVNRGIEEVKAEMDKLRYEAGFEAR